LQVTLEGLVAAAVEVQFQALLHQEEREPLVKVIQEERVL
jgi:hypothetical protein